MFEMLQEEIFISDENGWALEGEFIVNDADVLALEVFKVVWSLNVCGDV